MLAGQLLERRHLRLAVELEGHVRRELLHVLGRGVDEGERAIDVEQIEHHDDAWPHLLQPYYVP